ncbi:LuxR C-terminal-related transcriptional regulator [Marinospirillum sp.]|uniref:LuxR C-terminal-related transcriptional regulator n=1 Tax=Marinospirillum sp. TaxID=2183934 RepID=UPI003A895B8E
MVLLPMKFYPPPAPAACLVRERLLSQLTAAADRRVLLLQGLPGSGKSLLLLQWLERQAMPWCWLNLDQQDRDWRRLLASLLVCLEKQVGVSDRELRALAEEWREAELQARPIEERLAPLMTLLDQRAETRLYWVLDGLERLGREQARHLVHWLADQLPPHCHLVLTSRLDLQLKLAHWDIQDQVLVLNAQDLAFTAGEIQELFQQLNKPMLHQEAELIEQQTWGLAAAVRLMAQVSDGQMHALERTGVFLRETLLEGLTAQELQSLSCMAQLPAVSLPLLNRLLDQAVPPALDTANFELWQHQGWMRPSDVLPQGYSLHPLLKTLLQSQPQVDLATHLPWLAEHYPLPMIADVAFALGETSLLLRLVEQLSESLLSQLDCAPLLRWRAALTEPMLQGSPRLLLIYAWVAALLGQHQRLEGYLALYAEIDFKPQDDPYTLEHQLLSAWRQADQGETKAAQCALLAVYDQLDGLPLVLQVLVRSLLVRLAQAEGLYKAARAYNRLSWEQVHQQQAPALAQWLAWEQASIEVGKGHLLNAAHLLKEGLALATSPQLATGRCALLLAYVHWLQADLQAGQQTLDLGLSIALAQQDPWLVSGELLRSLWSRLEGQPTRAYRILSEAEARMQAWQVPAMVYLPAITALKANLWLDEGKKEQAMTWLGQLNRSATRAGPVSIELIPRQRLWQQVLQARALMSAQQWQEASSLLDQLEAELADYPAAMILVFVQKALIRKYQRDQKGALALLRQALILAQPEQCQQPFFSVDSTLAELLQELTEQLVEGSVLHLFAQQLLKKISQLRGGLPQPDLNRAYEPLSGREKKVLLLMAEGLSNQDIAERLFISIHTVKTHVKAILRKLDVKSRTQAVTRAHSLELV